VEVHLLVENLVSGICFVVIVTVGGRESRVSSCLSCVVHQRVVQFADITKKTSSKIMTMFRVDCVCGPD
jgi:hypothetical protein